MILDKISLLKLWSGFVRICEFCGKLSKFLIYSFSVFFNLILFCLSLIAAGFYIFYNFCPDFDQSYFIASLKALNGW